MENITLERDSKCSLYVDLIEDLRLTWPIYPIISINAALCITATLGNILILVALQKDCHLRPPAKLLFRSLASTDLCVGLISQPCFVLFLISAARQSWLSSCEIAEGIVHITSAVLCGISLYTLTAISVDRLLALLLGLRYRQVVTLVRVRRVIIISWLVVALHGSWWSKERQQCFATELYLLPPSLLRSSSLSPDYIIKRKEIGKGDVGNEEATNFADLLNFNIVLVIFQLKDVQGKAIL
ncbi:hypothetical protein ACROYT_G002629 [Oculina patagonica]